MSLRLETHYPWLCALLLGGLYFAFFRGHPIPESYKDVLAAMVNISAIAAGFLTTSKSILFSIDTTRSVGQLKDAKLYNRLLDYLFSAIIWSFIVAAASTVLLLIDWKTPKPWHCHVFGVWLMVVVLASFLNYRVIHIFGLLLRAK
jgi:hypothetical protein